jgi:hypothetical protein
MKALALGIIGGILGVALVRWIMDEFGVGR